jgi:hypothetical protein
MKNLSISLLKVMSSFLKSHWKNLAVGLLLITFCRSCVIDVVDPLESIRFGFGFTTLVMGDKASHVSISPNQSARVVIVQLRPTWGDQNYELRLQKKGEWSTKTIFSSGDMGGDVGKERIIWSSDSSQFILVTSHHDGGIRPSKALLRDGEAMGFLYDVPTNQLFPVTEESLARFN